MRIDCRIYCLYSGSFRKAEHSGESGVFATRKRVLRVLMRFSFEFPWNKKRAIFCSTEIRIKSESEQATLAFLVGKISGCSHLARVPGTTYSRWHCYVYSDAACNSTEVMAEISANVILFVNQNCRTNFNMPRCLDWIAFCIGSWGIQHFHRNALRMASPYLCWPHLNYCFITSNRSVGVPSDAVTSITTSKHDLTFVEF